MKALCFVIFFLGTFLVTRVLADALEDRIVIAPEDQICAQDDDCTVIPTDCLRMGCTCVDTPVNKQKYDFYLKMLMACWENQRKAGHYPMECDMRCAMGISLQCVNQRCQVMLQPKGDV